MKRKALLISKAVATKDLANLLQVHPNRMLLLSKHPQYEMFHVSKHDGSQRLIEAPKNELKTLLKKLNRYLQAEYYFHRSPAAYGFVETPDGDQNPRSILTNAKQHCNCSYLLNIDLKDFFYQISTEETEDIFRLDYFSFDDETIHLLAQLTTFNGRLTMGSPTSPVITNFAFERTDSQLLNICREYFITYTRYVDDCSFSSSSPISEEFYKKVEMVMHEHRFFINYEKVKWFDKNEEKRITGLIVDKKVRVPPEFLEHTEQDIQRLKNIMEVHGISGYSKKPEWIFQFEQQLMGKVNFISHVYGADSPAAMHFTNLIHSAYEVGDYLESRSWLDFNYGW